MENVEVKNDAENKQNNSLMRKTKTQLIEIILRKDNIEKSLRTEIKALQEGCNNIKNNYDNLYSLNNKLQKDYEEACDEKTSTECELTIKCNCKNNIITILSIISFISIVLNIVLYFIA